MHYKIADTRAYMMYAHNKQAARVKACNSLKFETGVEFTATT